MYKLCVLLTETNRVPSQPLIHNSTGCIFMLSSSISVLQIISCKNNQTVSIFSLVFSLPDKCRELKSNLLMRQIATWMVDLIDFENIILIKS